MKNRYTKKKSDSKNTEREKKSFLDNFLYAVTDFKLIVIAIILLIILISECS